MKSRVLLGIIAVFVCITLVGCGKTNTNSIVGKWSLGSFTYTFNEDKTCSYEFAGTTMKCTYEIEEDKLSILYEDSDVPFETTYSIDGNKLNVKDSLGEDTIYERK